MRYIFLFYTFVLLSCNSKQDKSQTTEPKINVNNNENTSKTIKIFEQQKFYCDSNFTTVEVNLCSETKAIFADSLLNDLNRKIIFSIEKTINENKKDLSIEKSKKAIEKESINQINILSKEIDHYIRLKIVIENSQKEWLKQREFNIKVYQINCEGGTACNAIVNQAVLNETLERIKLLELFYETE
jgi:uncharacterized protein YecT (DUF1311 family)